MQHNPSGSAGTPDNVSTGSQPYTWERLSNLGDGQRYRVVTPDGMRAYCVHLGGGFERCSCPGFRKYDRCRHLPAMQRALEREPFASHGNLDIYYGAPRRPEASDESVLMLRYACETALNYLHRLRVADLAWRLHGDLRDEADNELIPLLRNAIQRTRADQ